MSFFYQEKEEEFFSKLNNIKYGFNVSPFFVGKGFIDVIHTKEFTKTVPSWNDVYIPSFTGFVKSSHPETFGFDESFTFIKDGKPLYIQSHAFRNIGKIVDTIFISADKTFHVKKSYLSRWGQPNGYFPNINTSSDFLLHLINRGGNFHPSENLSIKVLQTRDTNFNLNLINNGNLIFDFLLNENNDPLMKYMEALKEEPYFLNNQDFFLSYFGGLPVDGPNGKKELKSYFDYYGLFK